MKLFDFGAFQKNMHMASREKYIFHMIFGASHGTPRIISQRNFNFIVFQKSYNNFLKPGFKEIQRGLDSLFWNFSQWSRVATREKTRKISCVYIHDYSRISPVLLYQ